MTTKEKIKHYIESKGISKNKFYTITGFSSTFLDSGNTIGVDKAKIIIEKFPDISLGWLVLDQGPMLKIEQPASAGDARLWGVIDSQRQQLESQQRQLETQAQIIKELAEKVGNAAPRRAAKAGV